MRAGFKSDSHASTTGVEPALSAKIQDPALGVGFATLFVMP
jgi:hypothetical protein